MTSEMIFNSGIIICGITVVGAVVAFITMRVYKTRLNKHLDVEFGKRRH